MIRAGKLFVCGGMLVLCLHLTCTGALAADATWRPVYDTIMRWVNFLILAFLLFKFGRTPIMNFLKGQRFDLAREIDALKAEKEAAEAKLKEIENELAASSQRFVEMSERIIREGERRRDEIIEDARLESQMLLESARRKADSKFISAKQRLRSQLVDSAMDMVFERLPAMVTEADNRRMLQEFLKTAAI
jgi:F-type H+-transporting ATPase subunit b